MGKLFGTDGIRGVAGEYPMTSGIAQKVGQAVAAFIRSHRSYETIVMGRDTRVSGPMIEQALATGIISMGMDVNLAGVIPTPGVAHLTSARRAGAGIVVSASHNPYYDNGIKLFNSDGFKFPDSTEAEIEAMVLAQTSDVSSHGGKPGRITELAGADVQYSDFLKRAINTKSPFGNIKVVIDCSNGATHKVAPMLFDDLGADVDVIGNAPDGKNINDMCGSQHTGGLTQKVVDKQADIGLAFDGDGDRLIAVDERGNEMTGDQILAICANMMKGSGLLTNNRVVSTVMSNMGLGIALKRMGIDHLMTRVGDRYVVEQMRTHGAVLGGENSGHTVFLNHHTTGDGILSALNLIEAMHQASKPLSQLAEIMIVFPQVLLNVAVTSKPDLRMIPVISDAIQSVEKSLGEEGRVLVRYSGTEPLCRIMVEAPTEESAMTHCRQIANIIEDTLGIP